MFSRGLSELAHTALRLDYILLLRLSPTGFSTLSTLQAIHMMATRSRSAASSIDVPVEKSRDDGAQYGAAARDQAPQKQQALRGQEILDEIVRNNM